MPFHFETLKNVNEFSRFRSVLIIPCRFCPAASLSVTDNKPYIEPFRRLLKTDSYEKHVKHLKSQFTEKGIKAKIFKSRLIHQFVLCMWTSKRRNQLLERAKKYEAVIVLGCEAAVNTIRDTLKSSSCEVFQGLITKGVMSIKPRISLAGNIWLKLDSLTPLALQDLAKTEVYSEET